MNPSQSAYGEEKKEDHARSDGAIIRKLIHSLWHVNRWAPPRLVCSLLFLLGARLASLSVPLMYKRIVDHISSEHLVPTLLLLLIGGYGATRLAMVVLGELRDFLFVGVEQRAIRHLMKETFAHIHSLSMAFHLNRKTGSVGRVIERAGRAIEAFFRYFVFNLLPTFFELICIVGIVFYLYDWRFGGVILATLLSYVVFSFLVASWRMRFMREVNKARNALGTKLVDSLLNAATVKYFCQEKRETEQYESGLAVHEKAVLKNRYSLIMLNMGQGMILAVGLVAIMFMAVPGLLEGHLAVGDFVLLNTYLLQVYGPLYILGFAYREIRQALVDMGGVFDLANEQQLVQDLPDARPLRVSGGRVEFRNISFSYDAQRTILNNVSFTIEAGQTVALVGGSGSGKSTLVGLLLRFYDPNEGDILIDNQPISQVTQASLRRVMGVVPQDTVLFNNTLGYNIAYGKPDAMPEQIIEASKQASLHRFVKKLPTGYETPVGERGLKLSGGEKQRVGIARALLTHPDIFIFDEATSSLDTKTEASIQRSFKACAKGHTTLIIAHRLSTVVRANKIIVLQKGCVVEQGSHRTLLKTNGVYKMLWDEQNHSSEEQASATKPI